MLYYRGFNQYLNAASPTAVKETHSLSDILETLFENKVFDTIILHVQLFSLNCRHEMKSVMVLFFFSISAKNECKI